MRNEIERILAKESFDSADLNILAQNQSYLTQEEKVRLGFVQAPVEEVLEVKPVKEVEFSPEIEVPEVTESKSVTRRKAVSKKKKV